MFKKKEKKDELMDLIFSLLVHIPETPNFTKFKVIEHKQYFYGITFCADSSTEYIFEDLLPAEAYIKRRMDSFPEYRKKFLSKFNGIVGISFSIVPIYDDKRTI